MGEVMSIEIMVWDLDLKSAIFFWVLEPEECFFSPNFFEDCNRLSDLLPEAKRFELVFPLGDVTSLCLSFYFF